MRHFSGEFEGVRLLMEDELDLIAGGHENDGDDIPDSFDDCKDRQTDTKVDQLRQLMMAKSDFATVEYKAYLYRDAVGNIVAGEIRGGSGTTVPNGLDAGWDPNDVVGMIHSHPTKAFDTATGTWRDVTADWNWDKPSGDDHQHMDAIAMQLDQRINNLRQYILHDGTVKEFMYTQNSNISLNDHDRWMASQEAGHYRPNTNCP